MSSDLDLALAATVFFVAYFSAGLLFGATVTGSHVFKQTLEGEQKELRHAECREELGSGYSTEEVSENFVCFSDDKLISPSVSVSELYSHVSGLEKKMLWPGMVASSIPSWIKILLNIGAFIGLFFFMALASEIAAPGMMGRM